MVLGIPSEDMVGRFRGNAFLQRGSFALAVRAIPFELPSFRDLGVDVRSHQPHPCLPHPPLRTRSSTSTGITCRPSTSGRSAKIRIARGSFFWRRVPSPERGMGLAVACDWSRLWWPG